MENKVEKAVLYGCIAVLIMFMIATAAIPAVLAYKYCWAWLFVYPAALLAVSIFARKRK
ncbi:MAG: hypothetical protein J6B72_02775 [Clostridia bacterium]|nr:hypothetical protein [Clostridia bacterium]